MKPDSSTIPFLLFVLLAMPALGVFSWFRFRSGKPLPPKKDRYRGMIALQLVLLFMTSVAAKQNRVVILSSISPPTWTWLAALAYVALVGIRFWAAAPKLTSERRERVFLTLPASPDEFWFWVAISFLAGATEEYAYRGVAYAALYEMTSSQVIALISCVLAFAIAHVTHGWRAAVGIGFFALLCHLIVFLTQTLILVIAIHIAYNIVLGFLAVLLSTRERRSMTGPQPFP